MAKTPGTLGARRKLPPQLPEILPKALDAARNVNKLRGWKTVSDEIEKRERRHPQFEAGTSATELQRIIKNHGEKLEYGQLEAIAGVFGIPSGVLLDVSHVMSHLRRGTDADNELAKQYAKGLRALAAAITKQAKVTTKLDIATQIKRMEALYRVWKKKGLDVTMPSKTTNDA